MRHVAKTLKESLTQKFPDAKTDEILKVNNLFKCRISIVSPCSYNLITSPHCIIILF